MRDVRIRITYQNNLKMPSNPVNCHQRHLARDKERFRYQKQNGSLFGLFIHDSAINLSYSNRSKF